jgi:hypothetical protein
MPNTGPLGAPAPSGSAASLFLRHNRAVALGSMLITLVSCSQSSPNPPRKADPSDKVEIIGTFPESVAMSVLFVAIPRRFNVALI